MKIKYPIFMVSSAEKIIQTNFVQGFLRIFRDTQDSHRVLAIIPLTLFISHSWYMKTAPQISLAAARISNDELFWIILCGFITSAYFCWAVFSSKFNPPLYVRQTIFAIWTGLAHRWTYDLETLGTPYLTAVSLVALTSYLPYAFWGLRPDQLFQKMKDEYKARKNAEPAVVAVPTPTQEASPAKAENSKVA